MLVQNYDLVTDRLSRMNITGTGIYLKIITVWIYKEKLSTTLHKLLVVVDAELRIGCFEGERHLRVQTSQMSWLMKKADPKKKKCCDLLMITSVTR